MSVKSNHIDPQYANKETRDRLGDKSKICFDARGKWKKLALRLGLDVKAIETQMDEIIKIKEEQKGELNESPRQRAQTRRERRANKRRYDKYITRITAKMRNRDEIRPEQTDDGATAE
jgi:hypothetical protein